MRAEFDADAAQDQQPQHHHERQIESAEAGSVELRESKVEGASGGHQPDLVAVPDGADGGENATALFVRLGDREVNRAGAQVESIEHDISRDHERDNPVPQGLHIRFAFTGLKLQSFLTQVARLKPCPLVVNLFGALSLAVQKL